MGLLVISDYARDSSGLRGAHILSLRVSVLIYSRGSNGDRACQLLSRHRLTRHVLRRSAFSLRAVYGCCLRDFCGGDLLVIYYYWRNLERFFDKRPIFCDVYWGKLDFLPPAFLRAPRYTAAVLWLPRLHSNLKRCKEIRKIDEYHWCDSVFMVDVRSHHHQ